jgi:hypothetical protein
MSVIGQSDDIVEIELKLTERQRERIVRRLVDWGYLDADDCLDEDDADYARKLGAAISRALPRIALDGMYKRARR